MTTAGAEVTAAPTADRPFDPWRIAAGGIGRSVAGQALAAILDHEAGSKVRSRERKAADERAFRETVDTLIADAAHRECGQPGAWVRISLSEKQLGRGPARYRAAAMNTKLPHAVRMLAALEWLELEVGGRYHFGRYFGETPEERAPMESRIRAGNMLRQAIELYGLTTATFGRSELGRREPVVLRNKAKVPLKYQDNPATNRLRQEMRQINHWIAAADITYSGGNAEGRRIDAGDRWLRRIFTPDSFEHHGRLYGGFWQALNNAERLEGIRIAGQRVAVLDYGQSAPRILYGIAKERGLIAEAPQWVDAYAIPGLERSRPLVKQAFNSMLNASKRMTQPPDDPRRAADDDGYDETAVRYQLLAAGKSWAEVRNLIEDFHAPVLPLFYCRQGLTITRQESDILVAVLLACGEQGIAALPIHDALIVPAECREEAAGIMRGTFHRYTHLHIPISECM